jgi:hypothetical protein
MKNHAQPVKTVLKLIVMNNFKTVHYQNYQKLIENPETIMTRRDKFSTKPATRTLYTALNSKCPLCIKLHNKSKKFRTPYHLLYHLKDHNSDDECSTNITINEIKEIVKNICKAIRLKMFFTENRGVVVDC